MQDRMQKKMAEKQIHKKVARKTNKKYSFKKSVTHIKLDNANGGKIEALNAVADEYLGLVQTFCDYLIDHEQITPDKNDDIPIFKSPLSARWQRCAWMQACGIVQSWFSNGRINRPKLDAISIQASPNVAVLQKVKTSRSFDYWIRLSTLEKGKPVFLPIKLYNRAKGTLEKYPCLFTGIRLDKKDGKWFISLVVGKTPNKPEAAGEVVGVDIGMKKMLVTSTDRVYGEISCEVRTRNKLSREKMARKQKLNSCLKKKGLAAVKLFDGKTERFVRNEIGRYINQLIIDLPESSPVALERLGVKDMKFKSREMNSRLKASQLGYMHDHLIFRLDDVGIRYLSVQPAFSSQQCSECGYIAKTNRPDQEHFHCLNCGFTGNADFNAARVLAKRFGDDELQKCSFKDVKALLDKRFEESLPVARSATAGLETELFGFPVTQSSQADVYSCL
jgi:predicted RNA-binding Zn-ribbon protein involved in translation (DUF1610 family)